MTNPTVGSVELDRVNENVFNFWNRQVPDTTPTDICARQQARKITRLEAFAFEAPIYPAPPAHAKEANLLWLYDVRSINKQYD